MRIKTYFTIIHFLIQAPTPRQHKRKSRPICVGRLLFKNILVYLAGIGEAPAAALPDWYGSGLPSLR